MDNYYQKYLKYKMKYIQLKGGKSWEEMYNNLNTICTEDNDVLMTKYLALSKKLTALNLELAARTAKPVSVAQKVVEERPKDVAERGRQILIAQAQAAERARQAEQLAERARQAALVQPVQPVQPVQQLPQVTPIVLPNAWKGRKLDIELYKPQAGGEANEIWPLLSMKWSEGTVRKLGIRGKTDKTVDFEIVGKNLSKQSAPMFARGTFTAIYEMKNTNVSDPQGYILRIYKRESRTHLVDDAKIESEFKKYTSNLIKIYYYGTIDINSGQFALGKETDEKGNIANYFKIGTNQYNYNFDYIITKKYNPLQLSGYPEVILNTDFTNSRKFEYLYENVVMLEKLQADKMFHSDYKPANIGYDHPNSKPVLIDYDFTTLLLATDPTIYENKGGYINFNFATTPYIEPEYIKNKQVSYITRYPDLFIKYSVGGLGKLIQTLQIKFTTGFITLPVNLQTRGIKLITTNLVASLQLNSSEYDSIPRYTEIKAILDHLRRFVAA